MAPAYTVRGFDNGVGKRQNQFADESVGIIIEI